MADIPRYLGHCLVARSKYSNNGWLPHQRLVYLLHQPRPLINEARVELH
jgi:hypothetical protein